MLIDCLAFLSGFLLDVVWALCVNAISKGNAKTAAHLSVMIYLCTLVSTVLIVERCVAACVSYAVGGWIGTYAVVKLSKLSKP